jgi:molybdopterin converting factor small subunit
MDITIHFYSYFKELTGCERATLRVAPGGTLGDVLKDLIARFPKLEPMQNSTLAAVGLEYQGRGYVLNEGDEVSLFPPVQGG